MEVKVHQHGFVRLVDSMGDDTSIVRAARVSYGEGSKGADADARLIRYLMKHKHTSPFEMVQFTFHIKAPLFVVRQWQRHRTGSFNEVSARYTEVKTEFFCPSIESMTTQDASNKQERTKTIVDSPVFCQDMIMALNRHAHATYCHLLDAGVARELARIVLPVSMYTEFYWSVNLHNLLHFLRLRRAEDAQKEIRDYAFAIEEIIEPIIPVAYKAFHDNLT